MRNRGQVDKTRKAIREGKLKGNFTVAQASKVVGLPEAAMSNTLARMARANELQFTGYKGNRVYFASPHKLRGPLTQASQGEDPIELLLEAMARAEPILRKLSEARKLLTD